MDDYDETDPEPTDEELSAFYARLRARVLQLRQTTYAVKTNRRTPTARRALLDQAARVLHRSALLKHKHRRFRTVH